MEQALWYLLLALMPIFYLRWLGRRRQRRIIAAHKNFLAVIVSEELARIGEHGAVAGRIYDTVKARGVLPKEISWSLFRTLLNTLADEGRIRKGEFYPGDPGEFEIRYAIPAR